MALVVPTLHVVNRLSVATLFEVKEVSLPILRELIGKVSALCAQVDDTRVPIADLATNLLDGSLETLEDLQLYVESTSDRETFLELYNRYLKPPGLPEAEDIDEQLLKTLTANPAYVVKKKKILKVKLKLYTKQLAVLLTLVHLHEAKASRRQFVAAMLAHGINLRALIDE